MSTQPVLDLGLILSNIKGYEFSIEKFTDRLKLHKTVYLLQSFGIYLGYEFGWYLRGPYCTSLTTNAFILNDINSAMPKNEKMQFLIRNKQKSFEKFNKFYINKSIEDLEILASIHFLKKLGNDSDEEIKTKVIQKQEQFTKEQVEKMWRELEKWNLL